MAIEPAWRNAIDHRGLHWDARRQLLVFGEDEASMAQVFNTYTLGASATAGVEYGIALGVCSSPGLLHEINERAPIHDDRVLMEHLLAQQLGLQGIRQPEVRTDPDDLVLGPLVQDDILKALGALVACVSHLPEDETVRIEFEDLPPLRASADAVRRAARLSASRHNGPGLGFDDVLPIMASALLARGCQPDRALELASRYAGQGVARAGQPQPGLTKEELAARISAAACGAHHALTETAAVTGEASDRHDAFGAVLRDVENAAAAYAGDRQEAMEEMLGALRRFFDAWEALPWEPLPWFAPRNEGGYQEESVPAATP